jgi:hypothetical protein
MATITKKFANRLTEFLDSECSDYDLKYNWEWCKDTESCNVEISRDDKVAYIDFRYKEITNELEIELCEDCWYIVEEFEPSVKYFWMLISPKLFSNNG